MADIADAVGILLMVTPASGAVHVYHLRSAFVLFCLELEVRPGPNVWKRWHQFHTPADPRAELVRDTELRRQLSICKSRQSLPLSLAAVHASIVD